MPVGGWRKRCSLVAVAALGWGCLGDGGPDAGSGVSAEVTAASASPQASKASTVTAAEALELAAPIALRPGEGVPVRLATRPRAAFSGEVHRQLLAELGYVASDPAALLVARQGAAYLHLAEGEFDVWLDGRMPYDEVWLAGLRFDGSRVGDHVTVLAGWRQADAVAGWLIGKTFADQHGVFSLDALNRDPAAVAAFDSTDAVPGNGKADILAYPEGTIPGEIAAAQASFSDWGNIAIAHLGSEEYFSLHERFADAIARGEPMIAVASTPSQLVGLLRPGLDVYWLGIEDFLDDSNPLGHPQGELFSQWTRGFDGTGGHAPFSADECPSVADDPQGLCPLGWVASTRTVAVRSEFSAANPAAVTLFDVVFVPAADVSQALAREADGSDPADLAAEWIAANRDAVDGWLVAARAAALRPGTAEARPLAAGR